MLTSRGGGGVRRGGKRGKGGFGTVFLGKEKRTIEPRRKKKIGISKGRLEQKDEGGRPRSSGGKGKKKKTIKPIRKNSDCWAKGGKKRPTKGKEIQKKGYSKGPAKVKKKEPTRGNAKLQKTLTKVRRKQQKTPR